MPPGPDADIADAQGAEKVGAEKGFYAHFAIRYYAAALMGNFIALRHTAADDR